MSLTAEVVDERISFSTWVWLADHDLDGDGYTQITLYSGRGIYSESAGPVWMIGAGTFSFKLYY